MIFELPEVLIVERAGRAMALGVNTSVEIGVSSSLAGAASLAAARRIANKGLKLKVILTDAYEDSSEVFKLNLEAVHKMQLMMTVEHEEGDFPCVISGTDSSATFGSENFVVAKFFVDPENKQLWDSWKYDRNPYLRLAKKSQALTVEQAREIDRRALDDFGIPSLCLMENAGIGAAVIAHQLCASLQGNKNIVVVAGPGNNGGDAFVVARGLIEKGYDVKVVALSEKLSADAQVNFDILFGQKPEVIINADKRGLMELISSAGLIVDGIFGTGLSRDISGELAEIVSGINASDSRVLSLDIPSGVAGNSGEILGSAVKADVTVSFAAAKIGMFTDNGKQHSGRVVVADIGAPVGAGIGE